MMDILKKKHNFQSEGKMKYNKFIDELTYKIDNLSSSYKDLQKLLSDDTSSFYIGKMKDFYIGCMNASPFKIGDKVQLKKDVSPIPILWKCREHFLKKGFTATVHYVDYVTDSGYLIDILFEKETFLDYRCGALIPVKEENKHIFRFMSKELEKA